MVEGRSWQSLKERFKRSILPRLDFFELSEEQRQELQLGWPRKNSFISFQSPPPSVSCSALPSAPFLVPVSENFSPPLGNSSPSSLFPLSTCNRDVESLSAMENIRNENIRGFASEYLNLCDELGDSQEEITATSHILESRIIRPNIVPTKQPARRSSQPSHLPPTSPADQAAPSPHKLRSETPTMVSVSTQTGGGNYNCDICEFSTRDGFNLKRHKDDMHKPR